MTIELCLTLAVILIAGVACEESPERASNATEVVEPAAQSSVARDSASVVEAVHAHRTAISAGDDSAVASHHTAELKFFSPESAHLVTVSSDAPETTALWERFRGSTATWLPRDVEVQMFGNVAIAAFFIDGSASYADGTIDTRTRRVTEVWIRQTDSTWKEAHHHESPIEN